MEQNWHNLVFFFTSKFEMNMMRNEEETLDMHFTMELECEDKHNLIIAIKDIGCDICGEEHEDEGEFCCVDIGLISLDSLGSIEGIIKRQEEDGMYNTCPI